MPITYLITSAVIFLLALVLILRHKHINFAGPAILNTIIVFFWPFSSGIKLACSSTACALFWDKVEMATLALLPATWLFYILHFTNRQKILGSFKRYLLIPLPLLFLILIATNESYGLLWLSKPGTIGPDVVVDKVYQPLSLFLPLHSFALGATAIILLIQQFFQVQGTFRVQVIMHTLCTILPWLGVIPDVIGWHPYAGFSAIPIALMLTILVAAWSIQRFHIGDIVPIARGIAFEGLEDSVILLDSNDRVIDLNPAARKLTQETSKIEIGKPISEIWPGFPFSLASGSQEEQAFQENRWQYSDITYDVRISRLYDHYNNYLGRVLVFRDVSEVVRKEAEQALKDREDFFRTLIQYSSDIMLILDEKGEVRYASPSLESVLGYATEQWLGCKIYDYIHQEDCPEVKRAYGRCLGQPEMLFTLRIRMRHQDGSWRYIEATSSNRLNDPIVTGIVVNGRDVTERVRVEKQLIHNAFHDTLTGLPNRALFHDRLQQAIERSKRSPEEKFAVFFLDLDHFKVINDSQGHDTGDKLLIEIAHLLRKSLRKIDTIARWGGDEFVILAEEIHSVKDVYRISDRILEELQVPLEVGGIKFFPTVSIGIVMSQQGYERPEEVLRDADIAMYRAKLKGKACAVIFDPCMRVQAVSRLEMESELRQALENEVLQLYYQPIYSISQNRTIGFEALLRWSHSMHGFIPPAEFIPIAEETGLIIPLGQWVLKQACYQLKEWQQRFPTFPPLEISVNVSSRQISQPDFIEGIEEVLNLTQMDARWLTLEITESALMLHTDVVTENIRKLVDLGIRLSIDDFGTGYSSLGYIQRFPIHTIKIDRSFVQDIAHQSRRSEIVEPILRFTTELGLRTVAEGVESKEQLDRLAELGCRYVQGYYIARPLAPENVVEHLTNERERTVATALLKEPLEAAFYPAAGRF